MMRILQICPYDLNRPGGVRSHILGLSQSLAEKGHEVVIIGPDSSIGTDSKVTSQNSDYPVERSQTIGNSQKTARNERIEEKTSNKPIFDKISHENSIRYIKVGYRRNAIPLWGTQIDFAFAGTSEKSTILEFLRHWQPNVIHFHTPWTPFLSRQIYRLLKRRITVTGKIPKLIATFHDSPPDTWFGSILGKFVMPLAAKLILPKFDEVISVSEPQSRFISKWSSKKIHIIPNGIRLDGSDIHAVWTPSKTILFLGRLESRKGLMHALEAYKIVKSRDSDVRMIVAGEGPERREGELYSEQHQLEVDFRGMVSEEEKNRLLRNAGVFVSPALYGESFGIVLIEAMAKGVPVAGYGNPGYLSVVEGFCEENFPAPGDVGALAQVLDKILSNDGNAINLSKKGLVHVQKFDWQNIISRVEELYI